MSSNSDTTQLSELPFTDRLAAIFLLWAPLNHLIIDDQAFDVSGYHDEPVVPARANNLFYIDRAWSK